jgi:hypothetical protein
MILFFLSLWTKALNLNDIEREKIFKSLNITEYNMNIYNMNTAYIFILLVLSGMWISSIMWIISSIIQYKMVFEDLSRKETI